MLLMSTLSDLPSETERLTEPYGRLGSPPSVGKTVVNLCTLVPFRLNYYKLSSTYKEVLALSVWVRRRVRLYYWKQWKQPRTRRRHLLALGADPETVHMATRSRKGYWRMSQNEIVRFALNNRWLEEQGVPDLRAIWIKLHYGPDARV